MSTEKVTEERQTVVKFGPEGWISHKEINLFAYIIFSRQKALEFSIEERWLLQNSYGLPYVIPVVDHEPWQKEPMCIPAAIKEDFTELVQERIKQSISRYYSPVLRVAKHDRKLSIVHDLPEINKFTTKYAGIPPATEEFIQDFSGRSCHGLGDIMGGYDERDLVVYSRPFTNSDTL